MKRWYAIGPVATVDDPVEGSYQCAPDGCVGWIDTRPIGDIAAGFFAFDTRPDHLKETHDLIGDGTRLDEYHPTLAERAAWASAYAVSVNSTDTLLEMLVALLTEQADPDGVERCRPLTVDHRGNYDIHLGGHSRIYRQRFRGERDRLWPNLQRLWQSELSKTHATEAKCGVDPDVQTGKMLAELARLHKCPVAELTPKELKGLKPRKPTTRIYDDFERAELGVDWHNTDPANVTFLIDEGLLKYVGNSTDHVRALVNTSPLSSANHSSSIQYVGSTWEYPSIGETCRCSLTDMSAYYLLTGPLWSINRLSSTGSLYILVLLTRPAFNAGIVALVADGSTLTAVLDGVVIAQATDTVIASSLYAGVGGQPYYTATRFAEWWEARDLLAASIPPELLGMRAV